MAKRGRPKTKQKRRRFAKIRRRARRAGSRIKRHVKKKQKSIENIIIMAYAPLASVNLLSHNQVSQLPANAGYGDKIKATVNGVFGSIFDFNIFPSPTPQAHVHFDIEGAFNQYTAISIGSLIAGFIGQKLGMRKAGTLKRFGSKTLLPVVIAGTLGKKNNNPDNGGRHSPYFESGSRISSHNIAPQISNGSGRI